MDNTTTTTSITTQHDGGYTNRGLFTLGAQFPTRDVSQVSSTESVITDTIVGWVPTRHKAIGCRGYPEIMAIHR